LGQEIARQYGGIGNQFNEITEELRAIRRDRERDRVEIQERLERMERDRVEIQERLERDRVEIQERLERDRVETQERLERMERDRERDRMERMERDREMMAMMERGRQEIIHLKQSLEQLKNSHDFRIVLD
jgi:hypothetical protein